MDLYFPERPKVLYVGTSSSRAASVNAWLKDICDFEVVTAHKAPAELLGPLIDDTRLILLDADTPMAGKLCKHFTQNPETQHLPVVALGVNANADNESEFFEKGAVDFIPIPVDQRAFTARIKSHLAHQFTFETVRKIKRYYEEKAELRIKQVIATRSVVIHALAALAETRDNSTGYHIQRTQRYVKALAEHLSHHPRFAKTLTRDYIDLLYQSAPLHDIGKVGVPDSILLKPGRLTPEEFEVMKSHPLLGLHALESAEERVGGQVEFLSIAKEIAYCHHEKWDGSGYPRGLKGDAIPVSARLMALADVYDAVISRRVYKDEMAHEQAIDIIIKGRGTHFDPDVVDAFAEIEGEFLLISNELSDVGSLDPKIAANSSCQPPFLAIGSADDGLLNELQTRVDALSDEVRPYVVALLSTTSIVPDLLANVILSMLSKKTRVRVEPVHLALAQVYRSQKDSSSGADELRNASMSLIHACHGSKFANSALRFVLDLPSLLPTNKNSSLTR